MDVQLQLDIKSDLLIIPGCKKLVEDRKPESTLSNEVSEMRRTRNRRLDVIAKAAE